MEHGDCFASFEEFDWISDSFHSASGTMFKMWNLDNLVGSVANRHTDISIAFSFTSSSAFFIFL